MEEKKKKDGRNEIMKEKGRERERRKRNVREEKKVEQEMVK